MTDRPVPTDRPGPNPDPGLGSVLLPPVVHEGSAAVLVVDLACAEVTFANDLARQLVPGRDLPMSIDDWSAAAGLEDVAGGDLPEGGTDVAAPRAQPLSRIAAGEPVTGEAVTAARATAVTKPREVLWVLGLPLEGAPAPISSLALVVFLPARNAALIAGAQESAVELRDRAMLATRMSFTITDPSQDDNPLVWVNPAFTETTGYTFDEVIGHNCRFLQGPDTDRLIVEEIRDSLHEQRAMTTTLLNYRKDGTTFWNELSISPVRDSAGTVTHFVGVQADVTARVQAQRTRDDALSQVANAADRLALLADSSARLAMSRQPRAVIELLAATLTPRVGSWTGIYTFDDEGGLAEPYLLHEREDTDTDVADAMERLRQIVRDELPETGPIWRVLRGQERHVLVRDVDAESSARTGLTHDERTELMRRMHVRSIVAVPLMSRTGILGCVAVATDDSRMPLGEADLALVRDLAVRGGLILENTRLYARERATAATLQRSLLPRLPRLEGIEVAASYVPAADEAAVGGDWYDVFALRPEPGAPADSAGVAMVVGDVMGHNYDSAARMGKLSTIVRSYAWPGSDPWTVLTAVDELLEGTGMNFLATCVFARLSCHDGGATLEYSSAGHPPLVLREVDGTTRVLDDARGPMLGVARLLPEGTERPPTASVELQPGSTLIAFTDGLTDAFGAEPDIDEGLAAIRAVTESLAPEASPRALVDALTGAVERQIDDVAVVALRIARSGDTA